MRQGRIVSHPETPRKHATLLEIADRLGRDRSNTRKLLMRIGPELGIEIQKARLAEARGQPSLVVSAEDADRFVDAVRQGGYVVRDGTAAAAPAPISSWGFFYVIQLVPELAEGRVKIGYAASVQQRFADHRTACPTARLVQSWPCKSAWENAAIASITRVGCSALSQEVFDCASLEELLDRAEAFFEMMPKVVEH